MIEAGLKSAIWTLAICASLLTGCATAPDTADTDAQASALPAAEFMLTFDDGPLPRYTERVLDMLATLDAVDGTPVKAGFFLLADAPESFRQRRYHYAPYELWSNKGSIARYPDIARRIQQEGHVIGNHSTHHGWMHWPWQHSQETIAAELTQWETITEPVLGVQKARLFRPPYQVLTRNIRTVANELGYQIVIGESAGDAVPLMTLGMIKARTAALLKNWDKPYPCVLVFHDMRPATYEHLDDIVRNLQQQGFRLVHFDPTRL